MVPPWPSELLRLEMEKLGAAQEGISIMLGKSHQAFKFRNLGPEEALILKQEALARGAELAIHKDVLTKQIQRSDALLWGTRTQLLGLAEKIESQPFGLRELATDLKLLMKNVLKRRWTIKAGNTNLELGKKPLVMGVLNITPDSFSDGGRFLEPETAIKRGLQMVEEGAKIIDIGGESSRPFSASPGKDTEIKRVLPVIRKLCRETDTPLSIDSYNPAVVEEAISAGASIINDITGLRSQKMMELVADSGLPVVLMHMKGEPGTMQNNPSYRDVTQEIDLFFEEQMDHALEFGISQGQIILDPGIGFGKTAGHNLSILNRLFEFSGLGRPLLVGTSKKSFIGHIQGSPVDQRLEGSLSTVVSSLLRGACLFRVHDVKETVQALELAAAVRDSL